MLQIVFVECNNLSQLEEDVNSKIRVLKGKTVDVKFETYKDKCVAMIIYDY